jgi:hypothetical protein
MRQMGDCGHVYNPSYSGGSDQEDHGSKPALANNWRDLIFKIPNTKRAGGVAQGVGPEFKPSTKKIYIYVYIHIYRRSFL